MIFYCDSLRVYLVLFKRDELEVQQEFEKVWPIFRDFIQSLPSPLCIMAHNGYQHDFPLLAYNFLIHKIENTNFSDDVLMFSKLFDIFRYTSLIH